MAAKKAKKAKGGAGKAGKKGMAGGGEMMLVASKVKAALKGAGCNTASDAMEGLNSWVGWLIDQAARRAAANGRKTVRAHDFILM
jgi:hypothetical protein